MKDNKVKLVVFDWAGTTVDYGCMAPYVVFDRVFADKGIKLTKEEILKPMGMEKKDHIRELLKTEHASRMWLEKYSRQWNEEDIDALYEDFEERLASVVAEFSQPIEGVADAVDKLRSMGIHIGSTTGYTGAMMENVIPRAEAMGYKPDYVVTPEMVGSGRPAPFMLYENMRKFGIYPVKSVVKVGDTVMDILEGKNGGAWSVGVIDGSSELGLSKEEVSALSEAELSELYKRARENYLAAGADFVIDNMSELPALIEEINKIMGEEK